jgi:hypothetical protein
MDDTIISIPYLEPGIISHLRSRLGELGGSIVISDIWTPALQREGDVSIMDVLLRVHGITKAELEKVNMVRKWLRVITLADLASLDGKYIPSNRFTGGWRAKSNLQWPNQPPPTTEMRTVFRQVIKRVFCSSNKFLPLRLDVPLDKPLGRWFKAERNTLAQYYRTSQTIFQRSDDNIYQRYIEKPGSNYYIFDGTRDNLPPEAHPIDCTQKNGKCFPAQEFQFSPPSIESDSDPPVNLEIVDLDLLR